MILSHLCSFWSVLFQCLKCSYSGLLALPEVALGLFGDPLTWSHVFLFYVTLITGFLCPSCARPRVSCFTEPRVLGPGLFFCSVPVHMAYCTVPLPPPGVAVICRCSARSFLEAEEGEGQCPEAGRVAHIRFLGSVVVLLHST